MNTKSTPTFMNFHRWGIPWFKFLTTKRTPPCPPFKARPISLIYLFYGIMEVRKYVYYLAWMKETFEIPFDWMQLSQLGHHWFATSKQKSKRKMGHWKTLSRDIILEGFDQNPINAWRWDSTLCFSLASPLLLFAHECLDFSHWI